MKVKSLTQGIMAGTLTAHATLFNPALHAEQTIEEQIVSIPTLPAIDKTAFSASKLSGDELRNEVGSTLGYTLSRQPGISNASFGPGVGQPVIRGQQGPRVTTLVNGSSVADASNISVDHVVAVEAASAQSIEVLRGPATLLYGGGAIGGIVNVIDRRTPKINSEESGSSLEYRHASVNDANTTLLQTTQVGAKYGFHAAGVYRNANNTDIPVEAVAGEPETDGILLNSDNESHDIVIGGSRFLDSGFVGFSYQTLDNKYGIPPSGEQLEENELIVLDAEQERFDLRGENSFDGGGLEQLRWSITYSDYEHTEIASGESGTVFSNENLESRVELKHRLGSLWSGAAGLQLRTRNFSAVGDEAFIPAVDITSYGLFVLEQTQIAGALLEFGARYDYDKIETNDAVGDPATAGASEDFNSFSLSTSALWALNDGWTTALALTRSERAPVVEELFSNPLNGNPEWIVHEPTELIEVGIVSRGEKAEKETATNLDWTLSYKSQSLSGFVTAYFNSVADYIYLQDTGITDPAVPLAGEEAVAIANFEQEDAEFYGIEFELTAQALQTGQARHRLTLWGDIIRGELSDLNQDVPRLPPQRIGIKSRSSLGAFSLSNSLLVAAKQDRPGLNEEETDSYTRWDIGAELRMELKGAEVLSFLRLNNVTDEEIRHATSFRRESATEAGRSLEVGFRIDL